MKRLKHELLELACWFGSLPRTKSQAFYDFLDGGQKRQESIRVSLEKYYKEGYFEKFYKNGEVIFRVTKNGRKESVTNPLDLEPRFRRWDGRWCVVIYDIEEDNKNSRDILRKKLINKGFGRYQDSVWISPWNLVFEIEKFIEYRSLEGKVFVFLTERLGQEDEKLLAKKVWDLRKINSWYSDLLDRYNKEVDHIKKSNFDKKEKKALLRIVALRLLEEYRQVLIKDPGLPRELLPEDWQGIKVWQLARNLYRFSKI